MSTVSWSAVQCAHTLRQFDIVEYFKQNLRSLLLTKCCASAMHHESTYIFFFLVPVYSHILCCTFAAVPIHLTVFWCQDTLKAGAQVLSCCWFLLATRTNLTIHELNTQLLDAVFRVYCASRPSPVDWPPGSSIMLP